MCHRGSLPKRTRSMTTLFQRFFRPMCLPSPYLVPELFSYHCALLTCSRVLSYQWSSVPTSLVPEFCLTNVPLCLVPEVFSYHFALLPCSRVLSYQWSTVPPYLVPEFCLTNDPPCLPTLFPSLLTFCFWVWSQPTSWTLLRLGVLLPFWNSEKIRSFINVATKTPRWKNKGGISRLMGIKWVVDPNPCDSISIWCHFFLFCFCWPATWRCPYRGTPR